ncbi:response regulator [Paenibacillus sp. LHD-117]|uniref:response regulator n=1 Tax=Paenibacillus sp. LHD-117 TaxID=3071412 RepID=UPI0027E1AED2|nr:response regulator [Paenibacillus sp. LHD-117]MDQ6422983.1 response regulator [Paenibacillus sp. LHD-117]
MYVKVLLVDDEEIVCDGLTRFINWEELGYQVVSSASSAAQALVYMESSPVDLVISDIRMPVQNGLQLMEIIQSEYPGVRTIILSGYGEFEYARQALRLGASDFLTKPVNFGELKKLLINIKKELDLERQEERNRKEYRQIHLNHVLNSLAKGYIVDDQEEQAALAGLPWDREYCLIRIQIEKFLSEQSVLNDGKELISRIASQAADEKGSVWVFNNERSEIACFWMPQVDEDMTASYLKALTENLQNHQIEAVLGISEKHRRLVHLKEAYLEAGRALQYAMIHLDRKITYYREIDHVLLTNYRIDETLAAEILDLLASPEQWIRIESIIYSTIDAMNYEGCKPHEIQAFCIQILFMISQHLYSIHNIKSPSQTDTALFVSIRAMLLSSDVTSMKKSIADALDRMNQELNPSDQEAKSSHTIAKVQRYIDEHYAQDISLTTLSNVFFIHPIYLSRLFKEKTGKNYLDYVTEVRIMRAKELLKNPALKVYEICQMVGYDSPRYFSKLFKSLTGMTPKEYKESAHGY